MLLTSSLHQADSEADLANLKETLDDQLAANADAAAVAVDAVESACKADIDELKADLKKQKEEADAAAAATVEIAANWMFVTNPIHPTNRRESVAIEVIGKNFQQYDFSPATARFFKCTFALSTNADKVVVTYGNTQGGEAKGAPAFTTVVHCPSPVSIAKKTTFQLSLEWVGNDEVVKIPFKVT